MKSIWMSSALALCWMVGCSPSVGQPVAEPKLTPEERKVAVTLPETTAVEAAGRSVGDYAVFRFSGSYRPAPIEVTQRVIARHGGALVIDVTVGDDASFRLVVDDREASRGAVVQASKKVGDGYERIPLSAFEQAMASIQLTVQEDEGLIDDDSVQLTLGGDHVAATKVVRRVRVAGEVAFMTTLTAPSFHWGAAAAKVRNPAGDVLYQVEVVDVGHGERASVASTELYDSLD